MASENRNRVSTDLSPQGIGSRIYHARHAARLTGAELAERVGKNPSYVSRIENGRVRPSLELLDDIAEALGLSVIDLLTDQTADAEHQEIRPQMVDTFAEAQFINLLSPGLKREVIEVYRKITEALDAAQQHDEDVVGRLGGSV